MDGLSGLNDTYTASYNSLDSEVKKSELLKSKIENSSDKDEKSEKELMDACKTFEGYFLQMMYKSMRQTVDTSGSFLPKSNAEEIFQGMLDEENCKNASESGNGIGLAQMLYKQLSRQI